MQRISQVWPGWHADELLGQGNYGRVYKASRSIGSHTSVAAIKVIDIPRDESEIDILRSMDMDALSIRSYFEDTATAVMRGLALMDRLKGAPGIVHVEDYQLVRHDDGIGWTVLIRSELLESLEERTRRMGTLEVRETVRMGVDLCRGLALCHAAGIVHRNIKPSNVFRATYGDYRLGDFGLARAIEEGSQATMSHSWNSDYMAPEVERGHYDHTVDIYSLGIILYRCLNGGCPPFLDASEAPTFNALSLARLKRMGGQRPPLPSGAGVDRALAAIVVRAVEPKPADRWQSASELGEALQTWLDRTDTRKAAPTAPPDRTPVSAPQVSGPTGIHVDRSGSVTLCMGAATPSTLGSTLEVGTVPVDKQGVVATRDLERLLTRRGIAWEHACIATSLLNYPAVVRSRGGMARWVSTTNALAIDYALRELTATRFEGRFLSLHQEGRLVSLALYDWGDGVLEVLGSHAAAIEPHEGLPDTLERLIDRLMTTTGSLLDDSPYRVLCLADSPDIDDALATAYGSLARNRTLKPKARLQVIARDRSGVARGAALHSMTLAGRLTDYLLLDVLPFDLDLVFGAHRLPMIANGTTIPTQHGERICLRAGDDLALEFEAFDERGLRQRYQLPVDAKRLEALVARKAALDVCVDVDAGMAMVVTLSSEGWSRSIRLSELSPATGTKAPTGSGRRRRDPAPASTEPPTGLMELITTLDDVDLGLRGMSAQDLASPAGAGLLAMQSRLLQAIAKLGAEYYPALGETFDPHRHEAMGSVSDPTLPENHVVDELRRGYLYRGRIVRYSLVRVANPR